MSSPRSVHHILILGATGPLGILITREALSRNLHPTLFVRNPLKIPQDISSHPDVRILTGTLASAPETLFPTLSSTPFQTIISALGPPTLYRTPTLEISTFYTTLLQHLTSPSFPHPTPYILPVTTGSFPSPEDGPSLFLKICVGLIWLAIPGHYGDVRANAAAFTKFGGEKVRWTVYRVGNLWFEKDGKEKVATAGFVGDGKMTFWVERECITRWLVKQAVAVVDGVEGEEEEFGRKWIGRCPVLYMP